MTPIPKTFTPHKGLMSVFEKLTRAAEKKLGVEVWDGEDGLGAVASEMLEHAGVKRNPIPLTGPHGPVHPFTPRAVAEDLGLVKRKRKSRAKVAQGSRAKAK